MAQESSPTEGGPDPVVPDGHLRRVIDAIPGLVLRAQADGSVDLVNQQWLDYTGLDADQLLGWGWRIVIHPEDVERFVPELRAALAAGHAFRNEVRVRGADGTYRWFEIRNAPFLEGGLIVHWYATGHDIEDQKRVELELRQVLDFAPQHVSVHGALGERIYMNQAGLDFFGLTLEEWRTRDTRHLIHTDDWEPMKQGAAHMGMGLPHEFEARLRRRDGQYRWFLIRSNPLRGDHGRVTRWYVSAIDIEDRKQAEDRLKHENVALREEIDRTAMFEEIVGTSEAVQSLLTRVSKVAPTDSTVLITGETGTGKELIARAVHKKSPRADRAFISVNCAAIPPTLISSELFGHEKGAFTGAHQRRLGRFELAEGGTIFLDEVGELPAETQIALLRVLQERELERVGGTQTIRINVRVIAATNRDLRAAIGAHEFRSDLFYRLNVFPIEVPPLRGRREDVPLLVEYFIHRYALQAGKKITSIDRESLDLLRSYPWPGNIRELQNVIARSVILCEGAVFSVDRSWLTLRAEERLSSAERRELTRRSPHEEKDLIESALAETRGRVSGTSGAAAKLGIPSTTLESKIKALNIDKHRFKRLGPGTPG